MVIRRAPARERVKIAVSRTRRGEPVDLKVPIKISDELSEDIIDSTGLLDLASGEIYRIEYEDYDLEGRGLPADNAKNPPPNLGRLSPA